MVVPYIYVIPTESRRTCCRMFNQEIRAILGLNTNTIIIIIIIINILLSVVKIPRVKSLFLKQMLRVVRSRDQRYWNRSCR